ncbi:MAG: hypothetical protein AB7S56_07790 [Halothiobacillaceae bacterium]
MVAAPLWAASHALPEGEGFAGERAKQGYMLLLNVAMRPVLLTIGFIIAMGMVWALAWMGVNMMSVAFKSMLMGVDKSPFDSSGVVETGANALAGGLMNLQQIIFGSLATLFIGGAVLIMLIHRAFDLIFEVADDVMKWIGGGVQQFGGEKENMSKVQGVVAGQFGRAESRMTRMQKPGSLGGGAPGGPPKKEGGDDEKSTTTKQDPAALVAGDAPPRQND